MLTKFLFVPFFLVAIFISFSGNLVWAQNPSSTWSSFPSLYFVEISGVKYSVIKTSEAKILGMRGSRGFLDAKGVPVSDKDLIKKLVKTSWVWENIIQPSSIPLNFHALEKPEKRIPIIKGVLDTYKDVKIYEMTQDLIVRTFIDAAAVVVAGPTSTSSLIKTMGRFTVGNLIDIFRSGASLKNILSAASVGSLMEALEKYSNIQNEIQRLGSATINYDIANRIYELYVDAFVRDSPNESLLVSIMPKKWKDLVKQALETAGSETLSLIFPFHSTMSSIERAQLVDTANLIKSIDFLYTHIGNQPNFKSFNESLRITKTSVDLFEKTMMELEKQWISQLKSPVQIITPKIASISPPQVQAGQFTLTINGSNFDTGAIDQIYNPSGQLIGSGVQSGGLVSRSSNQIVVRENLTGAPAGTYTVKVKNSDGKLSNPINIVITSVTVLTPTLTQTPLSGTVGTTFTQKGSGFTPNRTATIWGRDSGGNVVRIVTVNTDSAGSFTSTWTAQTAGNNLARWAVDDATGKKSNEIVFSVTSPPVTNQPPNSPTNLSQMRASGAGIGVGASTNESTVVFKGMVSDPNNDTVKLQIELRRLDEYGGQFTGNFTKESSFVSSGGTATISVDGLINAHYHWRARTIDSKGATSQWGSFGGNPDSAADFIVSVGAPPPIISPTVSMSPPSGSVGTTFTQKGSGFTPNRTATIWGRDSGGNVAKIVTVNTDSAGSFTSTWTAQTPGNNLARWAVDDTTGQKSNEIVFHVTSAVPTVDKFPNVTSFSASSSQINQGQSITLSFSVVDDVGLSYVRLMRADDSAKVDFREIRRFTVSGGSYSGSFTDTPPSAGTYRYGLHVVDTKGQWNCERNSQSGFSPGVYGPRQVVVVGAPIVTPPVAPTLSMAPPSGPVGTTFTQTGRGFSPNRTATIWGRNPDGSVVQITRVNTDSAGSFTSTWTAQTPGNNLARWAVDDSTGQKSNEIVFHVTSAVPTVDKFPNVTSFSASSSQINQGQSITLSFSVVDDVGLSYVRLMRADDSAKVDFREIRRFTVSGGSYSGSFTDTPPSAGTYRYGLHVVDTKGQWNCERNSQSGFSPGVYGPRQVVVVGAPIVTPPVAPTLSMAPPSGPVGTTFTQTGRGFSPNRTATIWGRNPDGSVVQITRVNTDSTGSFTSTWTAQTPGNNLARWAVDDTTGQKSNEIVFHVTSAVPTVDKFPNVTSFSASSSQINQGQSITLSFSVVDDVGLSYVRLMRADDSAKVDFREIRRFTVSGGSYSGSFTDTPPSAGTYRYGLHVVDTKGQWNCERNSQSGFSPGVYGPRQVVVVGAPIVTPPVAPTLSMAPLSGPVGTTFTQKGSGFTPNRTATIWGRNPDGSVVQITRVNTDSTGSFTSTWTAQTPGNNLARWAVDDTTGQKSNEIVFHVTSAVPTVDKFPNVTSFSASSSQINQGQSITLSFSVVDDVGLSYVRLMRADDSAKVDFREIRRFTVSGGSYSGSFTDTPPSAGTYRYGLHVVDTKGQWNCERNSQSGFSPGVYGPRQVVVVGAPIVNPQIQVSTSPSGPWGTNASGQQNTVFYIRGSGFSPYATVQYNVRKPDSSMYPPGDYTGKVDGAGNFNHTYTSQCTTVVGTYTVWVIDKPSGKSSNTITEQITKNPNCK